MLTVPNKNFDKLTNIIRGFSFSLLVFFLPALGLSSENWQIVLSKTLSQDEAIKVALDDLKNTGMDYDISFKLIDDSRGVSGNVILVGNVSENKLTARYVDDGLVKLSKIDNEQGYEITTTTIDGNKTMIVAGGSVLGDVYGLYWIWDRIRVNKTLPDINVVRIPDLQIRFTGSGGSKEAMRNALRYGATWVWGGFSVNHLVPWNVEPERSNNEKNRQKIKELIDYAHSLHLKFFLYEDEFSYHPTLLKEFGATLSPTDPAFWDAVQAKYRRLLKALPEIDGVRFRTGELTRVGGNFKPFDVMHDGEYCNWSLAKRYRTWVKKIYNVLVGEFDKIYYHRTWVTSAHEQHSMAQVYKEIFTDDIPIRNLYMSPYLSTTDRYFHQPYNPTFNQTPHNMIVLLSRLDYHSNADVATFPTFPGQYHQGGLKTIMSAEPRNLKGIDFGVTDVKDWNTNGVTAYTIWRLAWDYKEDIKQIASDFASIHFGKEAADQIADIYLMSPNAYKYGIYIEPVSHGDFRSLPHLRLTTFPAKGLPRLDNGKKHIDFLHKMYLRCKPWMEETLLYLDHGHDISNRMVQKYESVKHLIADKKLSQDLENSLQLTRLLIQTNHLYVKTFFSYFDYRENPTIEYKNILTKNAAALDKSMQEFNNAPGFVYRLDGMVQLLKNVDQVLDDLPKAERLLANAPNDQKIRAIIAEQQKKYVQVLEKHKDDAVKYLYWQGRVDGRDLLKTSGDRVDIEHLRYDHIVEIDYKLFHPLPKESVTVIPVDIQSRSFHPFVLEQPNKQNNYTAVIYLSDFPEHGYSWWKFELYYIPQNPEELGLEIPWEE
jgi:hypothetical protein